MSAPENPEGVIANKKENTMADEKSTEYLIAKLFGKETGEKNEKSKYKPLDINESSDNKPKNNSKETGTIPKKVVKKSNPKKSYLPLLNNDTSTWLSKERIIAERQAELRKELTKSQCTASTSKSKMSKSLDNDYKKPSKSKNKQTKLKTPDSFEKYGVLTPSLNDVLEDKKKLNSHKQKLLEVRQIEDISFDLNFSLNQSAEKEVEKENILGCKHLKNSELTELFNKNKPYLSNIISGEEYSERHSRFHNYNAQFDLTTKDLTYNTSMIVFTHDQIDHMVNLLSQNFDPDDMLTQYFFKVLLPEFCTKVFMDIHKMTKEEALMYLETRPLDD